MNNTILDPNHPVISTSNKRKKSKYKSCTTKIYPQNPKASRNLHYLFKQEKSLIVRIFKNINKISSINLSGIQTEESSQVRQLLTEFCNVFSTDKNDNSNVEDFQIKLDLKDDDSVHVSYNVIPQTLQKELKHYIEEDFLNKNCITDLESPYSSPVLSTSYNLGHNTFKLSSVLVQVRFTTIKTKFDIQYDKFGIPAAT